MMYLVMYMKLDMLKQLLTHFYIVSYYPIFLLDDSYRIVQAPDHFLKIPKTFFMEAVKKKMHGSYKTITIYEDTQCYVVFPFHSDGVAAILIGPMLYHKPYYKSDVYDNSFLKKLKIESSWEDAIFNIPHITYRFYPFLQLFYQLIFHEPLAMQDVFSSVTKERKTVSARTEYIDMKFQNRELDHDLYPYEMEKKVLYYVGKGESSRARTVANDILKKIHFSEAQCNIYENQKLYFVQMLALLRSCVIDAGVDIESAFSLNQVFLQKIERGVSSKELWKIYMDMLIDFSTLAKKRSYHDYPAWVRHTINYVHKHLHQQITLEEIAKNVHLSPAYVSVQFKKLLHISLIDFIYAQKLEEAKYLLECKDMSLTQIAFTLAFSSQSYFSRCFKKYTGMSPSEYRKMNHSQMNS